MTEHNSFPPPTPSATNGASSARDQADRLARLRAARDSPSAAARSSRRAHPARGTRALALLASVAATGGIAGAMAATGSSEAGTTVDVDVATPNTSIASETSGANATNSASSATSTYSARATKSASSATSTNSVNSTTGSTAAAETAPPESASTIDVTANPYADGAWLGTAEDTEWGDVHVEVTISGGQIVDVAAVQIPDDDRKSRSINGRAEPRLEAQAIAAQSADFDVVSGATYTSRSYIDSLQAALDQAALAQQDAAASS